MVILKQIQSYEPKFNKDDLEVVDPLNANDKNGIHDLPLSVIIENKDNVNNTDDNSNLEFKKVIISGKYITILLTLIVNFATCTFYSSYWKVICLNEYDDSFANKTMSVITVFTMFSPF